MKRIAVIALALGALAMSAAADGKQVQGRPQGPVDLAGRREWPAQAKYFLPWPGKISKMVYQGNFGTTTHLRDAYNYYAWDFAMEIGEVVCAARPGKVYNVYCAGQDHGDTGNKIEIEHEDGEFSVYAHLRTGTAKVKRGDVVQAGQPIAESGDLKHLHFAVWSHDHVRAIPSAFVDVKEPHGVPLERHTYTSGNVTMTGKTIGEGITKLLQAEGFLIEKKVPQATALLQKLATCETILGNDRRRASELLKQVQKEAEAALKAARERVEQGEWDAARAQADAIVKTWPALDVAKQAKDLLREIARRKSAQRAG